MAIHNRREVLWITSVLLFGILSGCRPDAVGDTFQKMYQSQHQIQTIQAEITTSIYVSGNPNPISQQQGKIFTQAPNKSMVEMMTPYHQITITNGKKIKTTNPITGIAKVEDVEQMGGKLPLPQGGGATDPLAVLRQFDLRILENATSEVIMEGGPKTATPGLSKMVIHVSKEHFLPTSIILIGSNEEKLSETSIAYEKIGGVYVPVHNTASFQRGNGEFHLEVQFSHIVVNAPIPESTFAIQE